MGQLAKGKEPQTLGKEAQKHSEEGQSFLGPFWGQRGTIPVPSHQPGGEEAIPESAISLACARERRHAHTPGLTPGSGQASFGLGAGEGGGQGPHSRWWGSHLRTTLSTKAAQKHMDSSPGSDILHTAGSLDTAGSQAVTYWTLQDHEPLLKENF